jgi:hypothetical protein
VHLHSNSLQHKQLAKFTAFHILTSNALPYLICTGNSGTNIFHVLHSHRLHNRIRMRTFNIITAAAVKSSVFFVVRVAAHHVRQDKHQDTR